MDAAAQTVERPSRHGVHATPSEETTALSHVRSIVNDCCRSSAYSSASALGRVLAERSLLVTLRTSLPKGFHSLRHQFLIVQAHAGGAAVVVDLEFRERFHYTGLPGGAYAACVASLPQLLVAGMETLTAIVLRMCDALEREAAAHAHDLPPWRTRRALLANWLPERFTDDVFAPPGAVLHPVLLHTRHCHQPHHATHLLAAAPGCGWHSQQLPPGTQAHVQRADADSVAAAAAAAGSTDRDLAGGGGGGGGEGECGFRLLRVHGSNHGSKRKAEAAATGGSPAKAPGPKARSPPPSPSRISPAPAHPGNAAPPCVITGFSAPGYLPSGSTVRHRCAVSRRSSTGSTGGEGCGSEEASDADSGVGDTETSNISSSSSSGSSHRDGGGSGGGEGACCGSDVVPQVAANTHPSPDVCGVTAAAPAAKEQPETHGTAGAGPAPPHRRVSGLTRKLLESAAAAAAAAAVAGGLQRGPRRHSRQMPPGDFPDAAPATIGLHAPALVSLEPSCNPGAAWRLILQQAELRTASGSASGAAPAPAPAAKAVTVAAEESASAAELLWTPNVSRPHCSAATPPQPVSGGGHQPARLPVAAGGAGGGAAAAGPGGSVREVGGTEATPPPAPRLFMCKATDVLPRICKVRPMGGAGGGIVIIGL